MSDSVKSFQWIDNHPSITDDSASHFSRKVGNLAMAKYGNVIGWTRRIPAAEWRIGAVVGANLIREVYDTGNEKDTDHEFCK